MNQQRRHVISFSFAAVLLSACDAPPAMSSPQKVSRSPVSQKKGSCCSCHEGHGALYGCPNNVGPNGSGRTGGDWIINGLSPDALNGLSGLSVDHPLEDALSTLDDGVLARYLVECALDDAQSVSFNEAGVWRELDGQLGLATGWGDDACDAACQELVSACLLARSNRSDAQPMIYVRPGLAVSAESEPCPEMEAGFLGNLFLDAPVAAVCVGSPEGVEDALDAGRTCLDPDEEHCGFTALGECGALDCDDPMHCGGYPVVSVLSAY
ncbi:MAG: hypothetical protein AAFV53_01800 [Myxococcota bacterium]